MMKFREWSLICRKAARFEYWPYLIFYFPMFFYGFFLALKSRAAMYFSTANPCMKYGGVMGESKMKILKSIHSAFLPVTVHASQGVGLAQVEDMMRSAGLQYPVIVKPDRGERGRGVELIHGKDGLCAYHRLIREDYLIQEFIDLPVELGILYYRYPGHNRGNISSVTKKEFLTVQGDGSSTIGVLVQSKLRARFRLHYLKDKFGDRWEDILPEGKSLLLEPIGNHSRGTVFYDARELISARLVQVMDMIAGKIEGFNYGRFDIKTSSVEDLLQGKNIRVLELNGVSSEPTHIYDPSSTLMRAYSDVLEHMRIIHAIAQENHRRGHSRDSFWVFLGDLWQHFKRNRQRSILHKNPT